MRVKLMSHLPKVSQVGQRWVIGASGQVSDLGEWYLRVSGVSSEKGYFLKETRVFAILRDSGLTIFI